jgi:prophage antirepressor-like protein
MAGIILFHFEQNEIRYVGDGVNHEWVAQDVCDILGIKNVSQALDGFSEKQAGVSTVYSRSENGVEQSRDVRTVKESGLYRLIFKSRKRIAERFQSWVTDEVLPEIRKTGSYNLEEDKSKLERIFQPTATPREIKEAVSLARYVYGKAYAERYAAQMMQKHQPHLSFPTPKLEEVTSLPTAQALLTPTQIASEIGLFCKTNATAGDARRVNKLLESIGYQVRIDGQWSATETAIAAGLCDRKPVSTDSRSQRDQLLWSAKVIGILKEHIVIPPMAA